MLQLKQSYQQLPIDLFAEAAPTAVAAPRLLLFNQALAASLSLETLSDDQATAIFSGNQALPGVESIAQAYAGHQFGNPTMLGDGRAILLGEHANAEGKRYDIQLKGAGRTAFSRGGDGRAALGPMLREYLISEALAALGVATTRALAVVTSGEAVQRQTALPGAILTRVASSHIRVGTFQFAAWKDEQQLLPALLTYTVERHYPDLLGADNLALAFFERVMEQQIKLVVSWMRVGFVHGVLNTDNVTISGEAIDFGPCAFMDEYDPATVFSSIDRNGRYAFARQPLITRWNLAKLAEALLPLIDSNDDTAVAKASQSLDAFMPRFDRAWRRMMSDKLGLVGQQPGDAELITDWLTLLEQNKLDYTNAHLALMRPQLPTVGAYQSAEFNRWLARWQQHISHNGESLALMQANNPEVIPRNHLLQQALEQAEAGNMTRFKQLLDELGQPYRMRPADSRYCQLPSDSERVHETFCGT